MTQYGKLYLIPTLIAADTPHKVMPEHVKKELSSIQHFLAENVRTARRFLASLEIMESIDSIHFHRLDKDTAPEELPEMFSPIFEGKPVGVLSESGCPGVADPGSAAVRFAHDHDIPVVPLVGPSSIILALMGSGLSGQHFAFHGYLPVDLDHAARVIRDLERESKRETRTQIFIETPYRNNRLLKKLLSTLGPETRLCVALDLTGKSEYVKTMPVRKWRAISVDLPKLPAVFLFNASGKLQ